MEILHDGKWGSVCDDEWDYLEANVVCRQLGFDGAIKPTSNGHFGQARSEIILSLRFKSILLSLLSQNPREREIFITYGTSVSLYIRETKLKILFLLASFVIWNFNFLPCEFLVKSESIFTIIEENENFVRYNFVNRIFVERTELIK